MTTVTRTLSVYEVFFSALLLAVGTAAVSAGQSQYLQLQDSNGSDGTVSTAAASNVGSHQDDAGSRYHHTRSLEQSSGPWTNPDWINQQVDAITNMIISVASGDKTTTDGVSSNSTKVPGLPAGAHTAAPAVAADSGVAPPAAELLPASGVGQLLSNVSSIQDAVDVLNLPLLTGPGASPTSANVSASNVTTASLSNSPTAPAAAAQTSTVGHNQPVATAAPPVLWHKAINITADIPATAAAAATVAAAAAAAPALQLISLLTDLQPGGNTTSPFPKVDYGYNVFNTSGNMPLAVPVTDIPALPISRWVLAAWSVSNDSTPAAVKAGDAADRRNMLLGNFTTLQPQQVQVAVTANITLAFLFAGVEWKRPASKALQQAASDAAGGYTQAFVQVAPVEPDYGVPVDDFLNQDLQYTGDGVSDKAVTLSFLPADTDSSNGVRRRLARKLLQQQYQQQQEPPAPVMVEPVMTRVWVQYQRVDASNVTALLRALSAAWLVEASTGSNRAKRQQQQQPPVWEVQHSNNLTSTLFGLYTRKLLVARGAEVSNSSYAVYLNGPPMLTTNIRLAIGITDAQTSPQPSQSTDQLVALWAANATNIVGPTARSAAPFKDSARLSWLLTPEIWTQPQLQPASPQSVNNTGPVTGPGLTAGAIAGVAVGAAVAAALLAGLLVFLVDRRRKQQQARDKTGAGRRRRKHTKPRYLLPDPPPLPDRTSTAAAATAHDELNRDELRAELRKLGDSVTSAARFELQEQQSEACSESPIAAAAAVRPRNPADVAESSSSAAAAAASCSVAAADGNLDLSNSDSGAVMNSDQALVSHQGSLVPSEPAGSESWPDNARLVATASPAVPPDVSPTTASLALTGAAVPLAQTSSWQSGAGPLSGTASSSGPMSGPWAVPQHRSIRPSGMLSPFVNYAFDDSMQQGMMPAAAAAAIHAAYARGSNCDEGCSSKVPDSCCDAVMAISHMSRQSPPSEHRFSDPRTPQQQHTTPYLSMCRSYGSPGARETAQAAAAEATADGRHQPASSSPIAVPAPLQPTSEASRPPSMFILSSQRHSPPPRPPDTPAASISAARAGSIGSVSTASVVSAWSAVASGTSVNGSVGSSTVGSALKSASRRSPFACSYNLSELAGAAPSLDSSTGAVPFQEQIAAAIAHDAGALVPTTEPSVEDPAAAAALTDCTEVANRSARAEARREAASAGIP